VKYEDIQTVQRVCEQLTHFGELLKRESTPKVVEEALESLQKSQRDLKRVKSIPHIKLLRNSVSKCVKALEAFKAEKHDKAVQYANEAVTHARLFETRCRKL
jgi:hypothetical protein